MDGAVTEDTRREIVRMLPRLRAFARSLVRAPDQADDLVQSTCLRALDRIELYTPGTRLDSWLFRMMRNLWIDEFRRRKPVLSIVDHPEAADIPGSDGRATTYDRLMLGSVAEVVERLPEEQRSILVLVCVEGLKYREVAETLGIPIGTVMSRLARARLAVAAAMGEEETAPDAMGRARS